MSSKNKQFHCFRFKSAQETSILSFSELNELEKKGILIFPNWKSSNNNEYEFFRIKYTVRQYKNMPCPFLVGKWEGLKMKRWRCCKCNWRPFSTKRVQYLSLKPKIMFATHPLALRKFAIDKPFLSKSQQKHLFSDGALIWTSFFPNKIYR